MNIGKRIYGMVWRKWRILHYRLLSGNGFDGVAPLRAQPVVFIGRGDIVFEGKCVFGWLSSPGFYSTYCYVEAREAGSRIEFGEGCHFNNNFQVIAERGLIKFGKNLRIGVNCAVLNSDFHNIDPTKRDTPPFPCKDVVIGDNVFFGNNVLVMKGVTIGQGSTIGSGSVVTNDIPEFSVAAGVPAKVLKTMGR